MNYKDGLEKVVKECPGTRAAEIAQACLDTRSKFDFDDDRRKKPRMTNAVYRGLEVAFILSQAAEDAKVYPKALDKWDWQHLRRAKAWVGRMEAWHQGRGRRTY